MAIGAGPTSPNMSASSLAARHPQIEHSSHNAALSAQFIAQHAAFEVVARSSREIFGTNSGSSKARVLSQPG